MNRNDNGENHDLSSLRVVISPRVALSRMTCRAIGQIRHAVLSIIRTKAALLMLFACSASSGGTQGRETAFAAASGAATDQGAGAAAAPSDGVTAVTIPGVVTSGRPSLASGDSTTTATTGSGEPVAIDSCGADNPAGLSAEQLATLMAGGSAGSLGYLYPYAGTVFPRGILAPELMWQGADGSSVYVHIHAGKFDYKGCLPVTGPGQLTLPQEVWEKAGEKTGGAGDPFTVELTVWNGSEAKGPISEQITIANATLKGSIYYNSYLSTGSLGGSIYRIPPGRPAEVFIGGLTCVGCHTVSANGQRLITHSGGGPGQAYALDPMTQPNPPQLGASPLPGFVGLSPDGAVYIASAHPTGLVRPQGTPNEIALVNDASLYETDTGVAIDGSGVPAGAMMPSFAPDGTRIVFNDHGAGAGFALAVMDYDPATRKVANHRVIYTDAERYPGWPFFLPDAGAVVFARGENPQFTGGGAGVFPGLAGLGGPQSDLYIVDQDSGTTTLLARAMGLDGPDDTSGYVPFGAEDLHKHYYPTVSPVSAGGYFWLFFDSIRHYGNKGMHRQLWGTALSVAADGSYVSDPSHPAFYLPGQEFGTGNHRAFAALDPCKGDGDTCRSGTDCCGGYCTLPDGVDEFAIDPVGTCSSEVPMCAKQNERCTSDRDCCQHEGMMTQCIAAYCGATLL